MLDSQYYTFLGASIGYWIQTVAIVASAVFAGVQLNALREQQKNDDLQRKQRATVDAVMADGRNESLLKSRRVYAKLKADKVNFDLLGSEPLLDNEESNQAILEVLNNYEFMATGIHQGAFDEEIYKRMKCSLIINDWEVLQIYVMALRKKEQRPKLFIEFQTLAQDWKKSSIGI